MKNKSFSFVSGMLFFILTGWGIMAIAYTKAAVSEQKGTAHSVYASAAGAALRDTPEKTLSPDAVQGMLRKKGLFDCRRNTAGVGFSHEYEIQKDGKIVYDRSSGLMRQRAGSQNDMNYRDAKDSVSALNKDRFAGYNDWRLPTLPEHQ